MMNRKEKILDHVAADGPVSFANIKRFVLEDGPCEEWEIAADVNDLLRESEIRLYDDGITFDIA